MNPGESNPSSDEHVPGRIPESLIDAALDGEICDQMQDEIAHALQYDHSRRAELLETAEAVRALDLDEIPMPDLQCAVLNRLDEHDRFLPRTMRRWVRTGRLAIAAGILLGLMVVAGLQSVYPRLTTIGAQSTPIDNVASAIRSDTDAMREGVGHGVEHVRASLSPIEGILTNRRVVVRGAQFPIEPTLVRMNHQVISLSSDDLRALRMSGVELGNHVGQSQMIFRDEVDGRVRVVSVSGMSYDEFNGEVLQACKSEPVRQECDSSRGSNQRVERETLSHERIADLP